MLIHAARAKNETSISFRASFSRASGSFERNCQITTSAEETSMNESRPKLPARPPVVREVRRLTDRIHHQGGTARVLAMAFTHPAEEQTVIAELNAARDAEYAEVLERLPELRQELAGERARANATYAEVEESEADLERFRTWLGKVAARDYFAAPGSQAAHDALKEAAAELAAFEEAALHAEAPEPAPNADAAPRLRMVGTS